MSVMSLGIFSCHRHGSPWRPSLALSASAHISNSRTLLLRVQFGKPSVKHLRCSGRSRATIVASLQPLDLTEDNIKEVLNDARVELAQIFDDSVGITGQVELAELDGPFVKIRLKGRFWHKRSTVVARLSNYLRQRFPEILEVEIEDEIQLDDSPASF